MNTHILCRDIEAYHDAAFQGEFQMDTLAFSTDDNFIIIKPSGLSAQKPFEKTALGTLAARLTNYQIPYTLENKGSNILPVTITIDTDLIGAKEAIKVMAEATQAMLNRAPSNSKIQTPVPPKHVSKNWGLEGPDRGGK